MRIAGHRSARLGLGPRKAEQAFSADDGRGERGLDAVDFELEGAADYYNLHARPLVAWLPIGAET